MLLLRDAKQEEASSHQMKRQFQGFFPLSDQQEFYHLNSQEIWDKRSNSHDHHRLHRRGPRLIQTSSQEFLVLVHLH
jgi:hypothetical protein